MGQQKVVWNLPYRPNPFFTGREEHLAQLQRTLQSGQPAALTQPQAISGLGGVGKTQIALAYAYRCQHHYQTILWAQADTRENLTTSYQTIATVLDLPEKNAQESAQVLNAVKTWLQNNAHWLLILDNADDLKLAAEFLPSHMQGHVLLTTRAQTTGRFAQRVEVDTLPTELGALFLLRRAKLLPAAATLEQAPPAEQTIACAICEELGGLPLALDQAGAYIEETRCGLAKYQHLLQHHRADLLAERRGQLVDDHPHPVATTWSLSFHNVEQKNPAAADLLRLCAFFAPDAIPETIITQGAEYLGPTLALVGVDDYLLNQAIEALLSYSLLTRDTSNSANPHLSVHRLVQAVLKDQMSPEEKHQWAERAVGAVNAAFPDVKDFKNWPSCEQLLPHASLCSVWIEEEQMTFPEAARLLNQVGYYLKNRARYGEAEPLYRRALAIKEQQLGPLHPSTATSLNNLAVLYDTQGKYLEAAPLYHRALAIREQQLGPLHPDTAQSLNNLAALYDTQGKYTEAAPLYHRALAIREQQLGEQHPDTAQSLNNLAELYRTQGKYSEAEPLYHRALAIDTKAYGEDHPEVATDLNNLVGLYVTQGKYSEAEPLYQRALAIREQQLGPLHPDTAQSLNNLAALYDTQGKYLEAEPLLQRALAIYENILGQDHPNTQKVRANYEYLLQMMEGEGENK